jgi:hypothetical protein
VTPRTGIADQVIAIAIPSIPIIPIRRLRNLILRRAAVSTHGSHISLAHFRAALGSGNLRFALSHDHNRVPVGMHFNAERPVMMRGMNRDVGRINLRLSFAVLGNHEIGNAFAQLNLNLFVRQVCNVCLGIRAQAKRVGEIELQLRAGVVARRNFVSSHYRLVHHNRRPVAGISTLG